MILIDELKRIWKETMLAYFKVLSGRFPGGNETNQREKSFPAEIRAG
jgi:hypothetical protein